MRIKLFGKEYMIPSWLKFTGIGIVVAILCVIGIIIRQQSTGGVVSENNENLSNFSTPTAAATTGNIIQSTSAPVETAAPEMLEVYIIGEIANPDVYSLPKGSILKDAVEEAGGFTEKADLEAINLAMELTANMMIKIPSVDDEDKTWLVDSGSSKSSGSSTETSKVNINTATKEQLCTLPGVGESTAAMIIAYRNENGNFSEISDIMKVSGIKTAKYNAIKDLITVD